MLKALIGLLCAGWVSLSVFADTEISDVSALEKIEYKSLSSKQQENYNFHLAAAKLAQLGFLSIDRLHDDWNGADFIARDIDGKVLRIQAKGRLSIAKKYLGKNLYVMFPDKSHTVWYLYPHDTVLNYILTTTTVKKTKAWRENGVYDWSRLSKKHKEFLQKYKLK
jgi:hypothetical protein